MRTIPSRWETERFAIRDVATEDEEKLYAIFNACTYAGAWDESFQPEGPEGLRELIRKSVQGEELFRMQTIRLRESDEAIGYFHLRHDFPKPKVVWLSFFIVSPTQQRSGVGSEVMNGIVAQIEELGDYRSIWLRVYLKNWPAMAAWIKCGFTTILEYRGDRIFTDNGYASLILKRELNVSD